MTVGLVCQSCDALSPLRASVCIGCGAALAASSTAPTIIHCAACGAERIEGHRFCGHCGARAEEAAAAAPASPASPAPSGGSKKTRFFSSLQAPGRAKLILIKGEGMDGVSYHLAGTEHIAGRSDGTLLFTEDPLVSPRHANFYYQDGRLMVADEGSQNGVFLRIKAPLVVEAGTLFLVGEQLLRIDRFPESPALRDDQGTFFYTSPQRPAPLCVAQILVGGGLGAVTICPRATMTVGREGNDLNFSQDPFISGRHLELVALGDGRYQLTDLGSKNGTFVRLRGPQPLHHGDYVFLGQQLLRVEIT